MDQPFHICENTYFSFMQLLDPLPSALEKVIETNRFITGFTMGLLLKQHIIGKKLTYTGKAKFKRNTK